MEGYVMTCSVCNTPIDRRNKSGKCHKHMLQARGFRTHKKCVRCGKPKCYYTEMEYCRPCTDQNRTGKGNPNWKGGSVTSGYRQIRLPNHPNAQYNKYVLEHRFIVEQYLGRYLKKSEDVHHIDGNRQNNSIDNLMVFDGRSSHRRYEEGGKYFQEEIILDGRNVTVREVLC